MKKSLSTICLMTLIPMMTLAQTPSFEEIQGVPLEAGQKSAAKAIYEELKNRIRTLKSEITVFHYGGDQNLKTQAHVLASIKEDIDYGWQVQAETDRGSLYGTGYYVAVDPLASRSFAGSNFALTTMRLNAGIRLLDMTNYPSWKNPQIESLLKNPHLDLDPVNAHAPTSGILPKGTEMNRMISLSVLRELKVDAVFYTWTAAIRSSSCSQKSVAMVLLNEMAIKSGTLNIYTLKSPQGINPTSEINEIEGFLRLPVQGADVKDTSLWPTVKATPFAQLKPWMQKNLLGCEIQ